jgi:hypothetical protein
LGKDLEHKSVENLVENGSYKLAPEVLVRTELRMEGLELLVDEFGVNN